MKGLRVPGAPALPLELPLHSFPLPWPLLPQVDAADSSTVQIELRLLSLESEAVFIPKVEGREVFKSEFGVKEKKTLPQRRSEKGEGEYLPRKNTLRQKSAQKDTREEEEEERGGHGSLSYEKMSTSKSGGGWMDG